MNAPSQTLRPADVIRRPFLVYGGPSPAPLTWRRKSMTRRVSQLGGVGIPGGRAVGEIMLVAENWGRARVLYVSPRISRAASISPSRMKIGSASMAWICTGTPCSQGPKDHSPDIGRQAWNRSAPRARAASAPAAAPARRRRGEAGIDELGGQVPRHFDAALAQRIEACRLDIGHALVDAGEDMAVEEIWRVDDMAGVAQMIGEDMDT